MRLELTRVGFLDKLANHYTTKRCPANFTYKTHLYTYTLFMPSHTSKNKLSPKYEALGNEEWIVITYLTDSALFYLCHNNIFV